MDKGSLRAGRSRVDEHFTPVDEAAVVRGQECDHLGDFVVAADPKPLEPTIDELRMIEPPSPISGSVPWAGVVQR